MNLNLDVFLEIIKKSNLEEIKKVCESNKLFNSFCKEHKEYIYSQLIQRDFPHIVEETNEQRYHRLLQTSQDRELSLTSKMFSGTNIYVLLSKSQTWSNPKLLGKLLKSNFDPNHILKNIQTFVYFIQHGTKEHIKLALDKGAKINMISTLQTGEKVTPIAWAIKEQKELDIVKLLLDNGADINKGNPSPFIFCITLYTINITYFSRVLDLLLEHNPDSNQTFNGYHPLEIVSRRSFPSDQIEAQIDLITKILQAGAIPTTKLINEINNPRIKTLLTEYLPHASSSKSEKSDRELRLERRNRRKGINN